MLYTFVRPDIFSRDWLILTYITCLIIQYTRKDLNNLYPLPNILKVWEGFLHIYFDFVKRYHKMINSY
jgi:hypothetical protein